MVPVSQPTADDLRELLFRCRIHPNAAGNGVYLRGSGLLRSGYFADELRNNPETCSFSASAEVLARLHAAAGRLIAGQFGVENPDH